MKSMFCNIWDDFSLWVSGWPQAVYIIVLCALSIVALVNILAFLKGNKYNKEKKPFKWVSLVLTIVALAIVIVLAVAKI